VTKGRRELTVQRLLMGYQTRVFLPVVPLCRLLPPQMPQKWPTFKLPKICEGNNFVVISHANSNLEPFNEIEMLGVP
jgi:hypothetical protein